MVQNRSLWPRQVLLTKPTTFPVVINQRPVGQVEVPSGRAVDVIAISSDGLTLVYQGGSRLVPEDSTNVMETARRLNSKPASTITGANIPGKDVATTPRAVIIGGLRSPVATGVAPLESIRRKPSDNPAAIVPQIHAYLRTNLSSTFNEASVPPVASDPGFGLYQAMDRFDAMQHNPDGIYRLAELVLQRAEWLLSQSDDSSRLRGVYLASITGTSISNYAPDPLLTSAIFDIYLSPRIGLVPVKASFDSQTRDGVISNCTRLIASDDMVRRLQFFDLKVKYAESDNEKDMALYGKAYALNRAQRTKEALEVWSQIRAEGQVGWMKKQIADAWKRALPKEKKPAKKTVK